MRRSGYILWFFVLLLSSIKTAVAQNRNSLFIQNDVLVLEIDVTSPAPVLDSLLKVAGVSTDNTAKIKAGDFKLMADDGWGMVMRNGDIVTFNRPLAELSDNPQDMPLRITINLPQFRGEAGYPKDVQYGINRFSKKTVYTLSSGLTRFVLPGYDRARRVFLSGSFNQWSTLKGAMKRIEGGWIIDIKLEPGVYAYKFIADGRWTTDPNNMLRANDGMGNTNSIFYRYNFTVRLKGYPSAQKVVLTGDFNNWDRNEIVLQKRGNTWERQIYLSEGKHAYHFLVDSREVSDPVNPTKLKDGEGSLNSVLNLGAMVSFKLAGYENAKKVYVSGNFNGWKHNDMAMQKTANGWILNTTLAAGNYQYKFIVDGNWITDPANPNYAKEGGIENSFLSVKPNQTFRLKGHNNAKRVTITGNFNYWEGEGYTMTHTGDEWVVSVYLKPGKCLYKFRVNGEWMIDPANKLWEPNGSGSDNSVLWKE
ncbi:MAG: hypothetical protein V4577_20765 [Bacteroidota bacterium]